MKHRYRIALIGGIFVLTLFVCLILAVNRLDEQLGGPEFRIEESTASVLTTAHGTESRLAIQTFIDTSWSFATNRNPQLLAEVAIGHNLKGLQTLNRKWSSNAVDVIKSSVMIEVIDFTPARFETFSREVLNFDTVTTTDGSYISSEEPMTAFRI